MAIHLDFPLPCPPDAIWAVVGKPDARRLEYTVIESNPPLASHVAAIQVDPGAGGAVLRWETRVEPQAVAPFIRRTMEAAVAELKRILRVD